MPTATEVDPLALLNEMATPKGKTSKSKTAQVEEAAVDGSVNQWIDAKKQIDKYTGILTTAEAQILTFGSQARLTHCRSAGAVESSIRINGKVTMTQKCQYSVVPQEHLPALREAFGDDAERYFKQSLKIELTPAATSDRALLAKLIAALGQDGFKAAFKVTQSAEVTEAFHSDLTLRPDVETKARPFLDAQIIKPYKASLRQ